MTILQYSSIKKTFNLYILQLQLSLELSQIQEILSTYSVLLLFLAKYSFLFENSSLETPSLKNTHTNFKSSFSSPDPARDGWNWWGYCAGNPVMNVDTNGQKSINYYINVMQNIVGNIPHSSDTFKGSGCTFATMTGIINDYRAKK